MAPAFLVLLAAAVLAACAGAWVLRAYRRGESGAAPKPGPALLACAVGALSALGLYLAVGRPDLPDQPYAPRLAALMQRDPSTFTIEEALAVLHEAGREHPRDARPHLFSGAILLDSGRTEEAARAYDAALRRDPGSEEAMLGLGRAMVATEGGRVSPDALRLFQAAAAAAPRDPAPWLYQAMAALQNGDESGARTAWAQAESRMPPDDPRRAMAAQFGGS
ncbi:MAG TPA: tetratricopeptide repeat protein [Caulobacterales bacterium]|nr:tetratricopeptide repeat protein [Caulobacterales bacterium]